MDKTYSSFACATSTHQPVYGASEILTAYAGHTLSYAEKYYGLNYTSGPTSTYTYWKLQTIEPPIPLSVNMSDVLWSMYGNNSDASHRLKEVQSGVPSCVNKMKSKCPDLDNAARAMLTQPDIRSSFCSSLTEIPCPGLCMNGHEPTDYINWVLKACDSHTADANRSEFRDSWSDYPALVDASYISLFPWDWRLEYNSSLATNASSTNGTSSEEIHHQCPSIESKITAFALINGILLVVSVIFGRRDVVYFLTCHICGKPGSRLWPLTALVTISLSIGANVVNAVITKATPGFQNSSLIGLILLWASRPRAAWAVSWLIGVQREKSIYTAQAVSAILAEFILQLVGSIYLGMTVNHARVAKYLLLGHLSRAPHSIDAHIMYAGALLWICSIGSAMITIFFMACRVLSKYFSYSPPASMEQQSSGRVQRNDDYMRSEASLEIELIRLQTGNRSQTSMGDLDDSENNSRRTSSKGATSRSSKAIAKNNKKKLRINMSFAEALHRSGFDGSIFGKVRTALIWMIPAFIGQWLFWVGFLRLAVNLYCPPKLWINTTIWTGFSIASIFQGASL